MVILEWGNHRSIASSSTTTFPLAVLTMMLPCVNARNSFLPTRWTVGSQRVMDTQHVRFTTEYLDALGVPDMARTIIAGAHRKGVHEVGQVDPISPRPRMLSVRVERSCVSPDETGVSHVPAYSLSRLNFSCRTSYACGDAPLENDPSIRQKLTVGIGRIISLSTVKGKRSLSVNDDVWKYRWVSPALSLSVALYSGMR